MPMIPNCRDFSSDAMHVQAVLTVLSYGPPIHMFISMKYL